ncbi:MAG: hypothetical protein AVDCRST_MAG10-1607, partial [uncultured Acidimicrobiales bacterium]
GTLVGPGGRRSPDHAHPRRLRLEWSPVDRTGAHDHFQPHAGHAGHPGPLHVHAIHDVSATANNVGAGPRPRSGRLGRPGRRGHRTTVRGHHRHPHGLPAGGQRVATGLRPVAIARRHPRRGAPGGEAGGRRPDAVGRLRLRLLLRRRCRSWREVPVPADHQPVHRLGRRSGQRPLQHLGRPRRGAGGPGAGADVRQPGLRPRSGDRLQHDAHARAGQRHFPPRLQRRPHGGLRVAPGWAAARRLPLARPGAGPPHRHRRGRV